ncbi:hypothetical protein [Fuscibacter oryzae]|uniref:Uncharacterized protein n=1 Tax=Fuscibacter oryzae TaxID=2803939 RepID=A0A8J7MSW1_9RHOB|nr:hypothetical protein [Fuscibacter oryzae]MBL4927884.1 hypothetical protein [Fuscibacter oryzae]
MDYSIWTGVLMLSGAVGATLMTDHEQADTDDLSHAPMPDPVAHMTAAPVAPEHDIAAHRDTLAWFLEGEDGPGTLPAQAPEAMDHTAPDAETNHHDLVIPLEDHAELPLIEGFEPGGHVLELLYTPATDPATGAALPPALSITANDDGSGSIISLDGTAVAEVAGVTSLSPDDITLVPDHLAAA